MPEGRPITAATLTFRPLSPELGAEVTGADLRIPLAADAVALLREAWLRHGLLLFRDQEFAPAQLLHFTRYFGDPVVYTRSENACEAHPEVLVLSNVLHNGRPSGAAVSGRYWHTDGHFLACPPAGTLLYGHIVPREGADTWFADMTAAYEALPEALREEAEGRTFLMDRVRTLPYHYPQRPVPGPAQRRLRPPTPQPLVRTHPETRRNALYMGGLVPWRIVGLDEERSKSLLLRLQAVAFDPRFCLCHRWRRGDLLMWDNRSLAHRATEYDMARHQRTLYRTTIAGDRPFYAAESTHPARAE